MRQLLELVNDVDMYISQHAIYINKLEKYLEGKINFQPTDCHSCKFGQMFNQVRPKLNNYNEDIKKILEEIDKLHCEFHEISMSLFSDKENNQEKLRRVKDLSTKLFQKLLHLKQMFKKMSV